MTKSRNQMMVDRLRELQASSPDIEASAIVSVDGLTIASALPQGVEEDRVSAMSAAMLSLGERIANELLLKIGIQISPRTVSRYLPKEPKRPTVPSQRWMTFVRNHAKAIIAADFFIVVTSTFQLVYVLVIMEVSTRRILHMNVTQHPTAEWTLQQFRECVTGEEGYKFVIHDRDNIYSRDLAGC